MIEPQRLATSHTAVLREGYLAGRATALPYHLHRAWERSRRAGVPPDRAQVPLLLDGPPLAEYRSTHEVYRAGRSALEAAADLLVGTGCGIVLADEEGIVLHTAGDSDLTRAAERVGSIPGATWREDLAGNNAIGTALVTRSPVQFDFHEHWCEGWVDWLCAAAPMLDPRTQSPLAAIAICAVRREPDRRMLQMAVRLASTMERELDFRLQERAAGLIAEAVKLSRWFLGQGVLGVDARGAIIWHRGAVPSGLAEALNRGRTGLLPVLLRGEQEVLVADRWPCLAIPVWSGPEWLGHVLVARSAEPERAAAAEGKAGSGRRGLPLVAARGDRRLVFPPDQVLAVRTAGGKIHVITESGEWPTAYESMRELQERLPEEQFFQVDRGCLVNLSRIREIHPMFNRTVHLVLADRRRTEVPVSRRQTAALKLLLDF